MNRGRLLESRTVFRGRVLHLTLERVRMPNGRETELEVVHHPGAVAMVPLTADGDVVLVRQYRHAAGGWLLEVPAGKLDPGEAPEACVRRETEEEIGQKPGRVEKLGWIWTTPGFADEKIHLYLATELRPAAQRLQADEVLEVERLPFAEAMTLVRSGEIHDAKSVCALLAAETRLAAGGPPADGS